MHFIALFGQERIIAYLSSTIKNLMLHLSIFNKLKETRIFVLKRIFEIYYALKDFMIA